LISHAGVTQFSLMMPAQFVAVATQIPEIRLISPHREFTIYLRFAMGHFNHCQPFKYEIDSSILNKAVGELCSWWERFEKSNNSNELQGSIKIMCSS
jgi:hypothetical protein